MFNGAIELRLPPIWDVNRNIYSKVEYQKMLNQKRNEVRQDNTLEGITIRDQVVDRLGPTFQIWIRLKTIFKELDPLSYEKHLEVDLV